MFAPRQIVRVVAPGRFHGQHATVVFARPEHVLVIVHRVEAAMTVEFGVAEVAPA